VAKPKLLLADDSVTIRKVVELTFADEGIDVWTAADGDSAMQTFVEIQPDIVLVDTGLPGTSGYQICEMIKQDDATGHLPVLLLVGSFEPFDQDEAERVGADGFLTKPFHSIRDLVARVRDLLGQDSADPTEIEKEEIDQDHADEPVPAAGVSEPAESHEEEGYAEEGPPAAAVTQTVASSDIDELYQSSIDPAAEPADFDPVDEIFADSAIDDELIETKRFDVNGTGQLADPVPEEHLDEMEDTKEFDWPVSSPVDEPVESETPEAITDEAEPGEVQEAATVLEGDPNAKAFDWSPEAVVTGPAVQPEAAPEDTGGVAEDVDEPDLPNDATIDMSHVIRTAKDVDEPSPEFISLVAQRVVEKLSDQAIRDIAKDAVPRIAEKLIREALEEEKKP
jgi:CheY-like chemotaxis protein